MISTATTPSPDFDESLELLLQLHRLTLEDRDESEEADALRDAMDAPWYRLNETEAALLRGLSADLYSIGTDRTVAGDVPPPDVAPFRAAVKSQNWVRALEVLRDNEERLPPGEVAFVRGTCWANLGEPHVAVEFLSEAIRLEPQDAFKETWYLACMIQAGNALHVAERARQIVESSESPLLLLQAAIVLSVRAAEVGDTSDADALRRDAIAAANQGLRRVDLVKPNEKATLEAMLVGSYLHLAMNYDELGDTGNARRACAAALRLEPDNVDALMLQGWLNRETDPKAASADFHRGLGQRLTAQPAFGLLTTTANALRN